MKLLHDFIEGNIYLVRRPYMFLDVGMFNLLNLNEMPFQLLGIVEELILKLVGWGLKNGKFI